MIGLIVNRASEVLPKVCKNAWNQIFRRYVEKVARRTAIMLLAMMYPLYASADPDIAVTSYTYSPSPEIPNGSEGSFTINVENVEVDPAENVVISVDIASNLEVLAAPAGCSVSGSYAASDQELTCNLGTMLGGDSEVIVFNATGRSVSTNSSSASVTTTTTEVSTGNNAESINVTVMVAADLSVDVTGPATAVNGASVDFIGQVRNEGPDDTNSVRLIFNLPSTSEFVYQSASGTGWSCSLSGQVVTCNYSGAAVSSGNDFPAVTLTGRSDLSLTGSILIIGEVQSTNILVPDTVGTNDTNSYVLPITSGTDLSASVSIPSDILVGIGTETLTIGINNNGPEDAPSGSQIVATIPASLQVNSVDAGCVASAPLPAAGVTVTCTAGALNDGAGESFNITVVGAVASVATETISATVSTPSGMDDPISGNDTASDNFTAADPNADLSVTKSKTPNPFNSGDQVTSIITVRNNGVADATYDDAVSSYLEVIDTLGSDETFNQTATNAAAANVGVWDCNAGAGNTVVCRSIGAGVLADGATRRLDIVTETLASFDGYISNAACVTSSTHTPSDVNTANDCATASSFSTVDETDLAIILTAGKTAAAAIAAPNDTSVVALASHENEYYLRLLASNEGADDARTVSIDGSIPRYLNTTVNGVAFATTVTEVDNGGVPITGGAEVCNFFSNGSYSCSLTSLNSGQSREIIIRVERHLNLQLDGADQPVVMTPGVSISSAFTVETNNSNNSDSAYVSAEPIADISVVSLTASPNPAAVGQNFSYVASIRNLGPNDATDVEVTTDIDLTKYDYIVGSASTTKSGSSCSYAAPTITCDMGRFSRGQNYQVTFDLYPKFPFDGATATVDFPVSVTQTVDVTTTADEDASTSGADGPGPNPNTRDVTHNVNAPEIDLSVSMDEPSSAYDPVVFEDQCLTYDVRVSNIGDSRSTNVSLVDALTLPAGYGARFLAYEINPVAASSTYTQKAAPNAACAAATPEGSPASFSCAHAVSGATIIGAIGAGTGDVTCEIDALTPVESALEEREEVVFRLHFQTTDDGGGAPLSSLVFEHNATAYSQEQVAGHESSALGNNNSDERTTVLPKVDLNLISKTVDATGPFNINEPIPFTIEFDNQGPSDTVQVILTDVLPSGFTYVNGTANVAIASGNTSRGDYNVSSFNCTGTSTLTCTAEGYFPQNAGTDTFEMTFEARAAYPYSGPIGSNVTNNVSIAVGLDVNGNPIARDTNTSNNTGSADVVIQASSLEGGVFSDNDRGGALDFDPSEAIQSVSVALTGTDDYGNAVNAGSDLTNVSGVFRFERLPPGQFTLVETQPAGYYDGSESVPAANGTVDNSSFSSGAANNTISAITIGENVDLSGFYFQELANSRIEGLVYSDLNNNGLVDGGDTGIASSSFPAGNEVRLTGTDYAGNAVSEEVNVNGSGQFVFADIPPVQISTNYTVTQINTPNGFVDGIDALGASLVAGSAGRSLASETIDVGHILPNQTVVDVNFGELANLSIAGTIYIDTNENAVQDATEIVGIAGGNIRLTGQDDIGQAVDCVVTTTASGQYLFPDAGNSVTACQSLRPSSAAGYTLTETSPSGLTHTGAYIGSLGGNTANASGANTADSDANVYAVSGIVINAAQTATDYDFGEIGQGLMGAVYLDVNNNGQREANEAGIPGVEISLSGTTNTGQNVCDLSPGCSATTDANGTFQFAQLPGSDTSGYTLTEQAQNTAPLNAFADGAERAGEVNGSPSGVAGSDEITGIVLNGTDLATGFLFAETAGSLSGRAYLDTNDNGSRDSGEPPQANNTIVLSGTTIHGENVCDYLSNLSPAQSCSTTTSSSGSYQFTQLPMSDASGYTLTQTQPSDYEDGRESVGSPSGSVSSSFSDSASDNRISSIVSSIGQVGTGYDFGDRGAEVSGYVFIDKNRDGLPVDDDNLPGVTILLLNAMETEIARFDTDASGRFRFTDLPVGDYILEQVQPVGYASSTPNRIDLTLPRGGSSEEIFGETMSTLSASVFIDENDDGVRAPTDLGLAGVSITLTGVDLTGDSIETTLITDADGNVIFEDILAGEYELTEQHPAGYSDGDEQAGSFGGVVDNDQIYEIIVVAGEDGIDYSFGEGGQEIHGVVYADVNDNGLQDADDWGIDNTLISLIAEDGGVVDSTRTDADGAYSFLDAEAGRYTLEQEQPLGYASGQENGSNVVPIQIGVNVANDPVNFGERTGSLSGKVFNDNDENGVQSQSEPGIAQVEVRLTATDVRGDTVNRSVLADASGYWMFEGIVAGDYTVTETHPQGFVDATDYAGSAGGQVSNDVISSVSVQAGNDVENYRFTETGGNSSLSGSVWLDADHDRRRDADEVNQSGWVVELDLNGMVVATTTTNSEGEYSFTEIPSGTGYGVTFRHPTNNSVYGHTVTNESGRAANDNEISNANPAGARIEVGKLSEMTLPPGENIAEQSLPLDPMGVVYNSVTSEPVEGATVRLLGPPSFDPESHLVGGEMNVSQETDDTGVYQFILMDTAPSGIYQIELTSPGGIYNPVTPSSIIPPCDTTLNVGAGTGNLLLVQASQIPPAIDATRDCSLGGDASTYFLSFDFKPDSSADVLNNHLPIDPILEGAILVSKTTPKSTVSRGGFVPYTITARSTLQGPIVDIEVTDDLPAGFSFVEGSGRMNGEPVEPEIRGRQIVWEDVTFAAEGVHTFSFVTVVGAGVRDGNHVNEAFAFNPPSDTIVSNIGEAAVRLVPDPDFDCTDIIGKVWNDENVNGMQDEGELGLPGIKLATVNGLLITTDGEGRYHVTCPQIPDEDRGSNFILKLDTRSLPTGFRMTTDNPETIRLTRGKFAKMNFGAALHQVVRIDLSDKTFDDADLKPDLYKALQGLMPALEEKPSAIRIVYFVNNETSKEVKKRHDTVNDTIRDLWDEKDGRMQLIIENETVFVSRTNENGKGK